MMTQEEYENQSPLDIEVEGQYGKMTLANIWFTLQEYSADFPSACLTMGWDKNTPGWPKDWDEDEAPMHPWWDENEPEAWIDFVAEKLNCEPGAYLIEFDT